MTRSTSWSLLALSLASISYVMHRDISANIFLATIFIIQGLKAEHRDTDERVGLMLGVMSLGVMVFAGWCLIGGTDLGYPKPFSFKN